jgi:RNA polymerase sigma factor (TIGR02999 family)
MGLAVARAGPSGRSAPVDERRTLTDGGGSNSSEPLTAWLRAWRDGHETAGEKLMAAVQEELQRLARSALRRERPGHTLETAGLVNEAFLRLVEADVAWEDRRHFYVLAARTMRRVLVDHARAARRNKRGGSEGPARLDPDGPEPAAPQRAPDLVALDDALRDLAARDPRKARIVELHYFGGLSYEEVAEVLDKSPATIHRDLRFARAWLRAQLGD